MGTEDGITEPEPGASRYNTTTGTCEIYVKNVSDLEGHWTSIISTSSPFISYVDTSLSTSTPSLEQVFRVLPDMTIDQLNDLADAAIEELRMRKYSEGDFED